MSKTIGLVSAIAAIIGFILLVIRFWTVTRAGADVTLGFATLGAYVSILAAILGAVAIFMDRTVRTEAGEFGLGLGLGNLLALLIAILFLG